MYRFFLSPQCIDGSRVTLGGDLVHQLRHVLRLRAGSCIVVLDDSGWEYEVELGETGGGRSSVVSSSRSAGEPVVGITLYQALLKGSNFEFVLQKCTELGVSAFVPISCERCVASAPRRERVARWRSIIREAAELSGRGRLPELRPQLPFAEALRSAVGPSLIPWEEESLVGIGEAVRPLVEGGAGAVNIFIGPEGGFPSGEVDMARERGIVPVSLGRRLLRAETAALAAATAVLYEYGEMGTRSLSWP
ncbi:RsmE family RNA methyltransferase [Chloroflexota bacterium]